MKLKIKEIVPYKDFRRDKKSSKYEPLKRWKRGRPSLEYNCTLLRNQSQYLITKNYSTFSYNVIYYETFILLENDLHLLEAVISFILTR